MRPPAFHQSMCKLILDAPIRLKQRMDHGWAPSCRAMVLGTLLDRVIFSGDSVHVIRDEAGKPYENWKTARSRQERDTSYGVPCLQHELDACLGVALDVKHAIRDIDPGAQWVVQPQIEWLTDLRVDAAGELDVLLVNEKFRRYSVVDLKRCASVRPSAVQRSIEQFGWDVQGAAYREAAHQWIIENEDLELDWTYKGHWLVTVESKGKLVQSYPFDPLMLKVGQVEWERGQRLYVECCETGKWPGYPNDPLVPSGRRVREVFGEDDDGDVIAELGLDLGDEVQGG